MLEHLLEMLRRKLRADEEAELRHYSQQHDGVADRARTRLENLIAEPLDKIGVLRVHAEVRVEPVRLVWEGGW